VFGAPKNMLTDNGCEFNNSEMRELGEAFNMKIRTTAAERPWSNGVCERANAVIGSSVAKIVADCKCAPDVALAWAVSARNALSNYSGLSPNHLVFGFNPVVPNVFVNDIPAMNQVESSDIVRNNLNAMHVARKQFMEIESSEKLARAMRHNVRASDANDVCAGDEVLYKRNDSSEWHGPGVVIGRDGKLILVRHGGTYVRVHECRLSRSPIKISDSQQLTDTRRNKSERETGNGSKVQEECDDESEDEVPENVLNERDEDNILLEDDDDQEKEQASPAVVARHNTSIPGSEGQNILPTCKVKPKIGQ